MLLSRWCKMLHSAKLDLGVTISNHIIVIVEYTKIAYPKLFSCHNYNIVHNKELMLINPSFGKLSNCTNMRSHIQAHRPSSQEVPLGHAEHASPYWNPPILTICLLAPIISLLPAGEYWHMRIYCILGAFLKPGHTAYPHPTRLEVAHTICN